MSYEVKQGNVFGRIGTGVGQGLAEQVPKEIERNRLSSGLQQFEKESANLTPIQQLARLSAIPGITPQMIQSFGELGRQQAKGQALQAFKDQNQAPSVKFPERQAQNQGRESNVPSITKEEPLAKIQEGYIPPTQDEIFAGAQRRYEANPDLYQRDPNKAIEAEEQNALRQEKINEAYLRQHEKLNAIQDNVVNRLKAQSDRLGAETVPANVYSKIEDEAIQATKPRKDGGRGLTEQQAMKEYGEQLDKVSREYKAIESLGGWGITGKSPQKTLNSFENIRKDFEKRNDTENLAQTLISKAQVSAPTAYSLAQPVKNSPEINNIIKNLPTPYPQKDLKAIYPNFPVEKTIEVSQKLAPLLSKYPQASPLAIGKALQAQGYDAQTWLDYVVKNKDKLNLKKNQSDQLNLPGEGFLPNLNDIWLQSWTGME